MSNMIWLFQHFKEIHTYEQAAGGAVVLLGRFCLPGEDVCLRSVEVLLAREQGPSCLPSFHLLALIPPCLPSGFATGRKEHLACLHPTRLSPSHLACLNKLLLGSRATLLAFIPPCLPLSHLARLHTFLLLGSRAILLAFIPPACPYPTLLAFTRCCSWDQGPPCLPSSHLAYPYPILLALTSCSWDQGPFTYTTWGRLQPTTRFAAGWWTACSMQQLSSVQCRTKGCLPKPLGDVYNQ
eukprot:1154657-Pelagomonas_calceolata.AAC.2